jgi:hypothetical protein
MGIEPTSEAWEASILPLYDARFFVLTRVIIQDESRACTGARVVGVYPIEVKTARE